MNIQEFFQLSAGKWFAQRTSHHLNLQQSESDQSNIVAELLSQDSPAVANLCKQHRIDPELALCGLRITLEQATGAAKVPATGTTTVLVPVADPDRSNAGKLLQSSNSDRPFSMSDYTLDSDDVLTLIADDSTLRSEERLWFASENLRMRTSILQQTDGFHITSFFSEIRLGGAKPAAQS